MGGRQAGRQAGKERGRMEGIVGARGGWDWEGTRDGREEAMMRGRKGERVGGGKVEQGNERGKD